MGRIAGINVIWLRPSPTLIRFLMVGALGFLVEVIVLSYLCNLHGFGPYAGRSVSFSLAVVVTWLLNRSFTFQVRERQRIHAEFLRYLTVRALGMAINLGAYSAAVGSMYWMARYPALALVPASLAGLVVNYLGAKHFAFAVNARDLPR